MARGGRREGAGRPKGSKDPQTRTKEVGRELVREMVMAELRPLVEAQIAKAKGIKHLQVRNKNTRKFERVTDPDRIVEVLNKSGHEVWEIWTRDPDTSAFTDLMNRALDKPKEQATDVNVAVDWDKRIARMKAARLRLQKHEQQHKGRE